MPVTIYEATNEVMLGQPDFRKREFQFPEASCNVAEIHLSERYPDVDTGGYVRNNECDMMIRVMRGAAEFFEGGKDGVYVGKGMTIFIPKKTCYYWIDERVSGKSSVFWVVSIPAWTPEQHEIVFLPK